MIDAGMFFQIALLSVAAFIASTGAWWLARKAGLTDVQEAVREEQLILTQTLRTRVEQLEDENKRLKDDVAFLHRENKQLRIEIRDVSAQLILLLQERERK